MSIQATAFTEADAAEFLVAPRPNDDKYSHGVVGFVTGSAEYPGAAVLGVSAALHTGVGMVRFVSDAAPTALVLQRHPEVVCRDGRADAWVLGSGVDQASRSEETTSRMLAALHSRAACVLDAGALDLVDRAIGQALVTPHASELARMFSARGREITGEDITAEPITWAKTAADEWNVCVLLKGHTSVVATPGAVDVLVPLTGSEWLATAGTGDVLAGSLGAVLATVAARHDHEGGTTLLDFDTIARCAAAAATLHAKASRALAPPFTALELADGLSSARRALS